MVLLLVTANFNGVQYIPRERIYVPSSVLHPRALTRYTCRLGQIFSLTSINSGGLAHKRPIKQQAVTQKRKAQVSKCIIQIR